MRRSTAQGPARIVAIGDIHGSIDGFKSHPEGRPASPTRNGKWTGGRTQLIQTGDYMDRGEGTRAVLDLLMALEPQAKDAGGRAFALLGNHEVMNLIGETRDVTPRDLRDLRRRQFRKAAAGRPGRTTRSSPPRRRTRASRCRRVYAQTQEAWLATHPLGYVEYKEAFAPKGKYGPWLRGKPIVTVVDGNIFMHAGIPPANPPAKIDDLNDQTRDEIRRLDQFLDRLIDLKLATRDFSLQEILQVASSEIGLRQRAHRRGEGRRQGARSRQAEHAAADGSAGDHEDRFLAGRSIPKARCGIAGWRRCRTIRAAGRLRRCCTKYGAKRFVTGHTPQQSRSITVRFGGRAVLIDTGMLTSYYKGRASALEIDGDKLTAYLRRRQRSTLSVNHFTVSRSPSSRPTIGL